MLLLVSPAELAEESHVDLAEHVESRDTSARPEYDPDQRMPILERVPDDFVFRHEAGERWNSANRQSRRHKRPEGDRQLLAQTTHLAHILLAAQRMDYRAGTQEQAGL